MTVQPTTPATSTALAAAASGGLAAYTTNDNPFTRRAREEGVQDGIFLRLNGKTGEFITNNGDKIQPGTAMAFLLWDAKLAWQGFDRADNNKPVKGPAVSLLSGAALPEPDRARYPDVKWNKVIMTLVRTLDGGPQMLLTSKADSSFREIWRLVKTYGEHMGRHLDDKGQNKVPIVEIDVNSKEIEVEDETGPVLSTGKRAKIKIMVHFESYKIVEWASLDELTAIAAESAAEAAQAEAQTAPQPQVTAQPQAQTQPQQTAAAQPAATGGARKFQLGRIGGRQ